MNAPAKRELAAFLNQEGYGGCECDFPDEAEDGIIYCLPCQLRDVFGLGVCEKHAERVKAQTARDDAQAKRDSEAVENEERRDGRHDRVDP